MLLDRDRITSFDALLDRVRHPLPGRGRRIVGVVGCPGAGKTTLVEAVLAALGPGGPAGWIAHVPMDGFHLADVELTRLGRLGRKGAPDTFDTAGYAALLRRIHLARDRVVYAPAFDRTIEQPVAGSIPVPPACTLVMTEGNYLLLDDPGWREVRSHLDEVWFLDADDAIRRSRLVDRHIRFGKNRPEAEAWVADVDEPNARLIAATRARADLLIDSAALERGSFPAPTSG